MDYRFSNLSTGQILILISMVGFFLLTGHQLASREKGHAKIPFQKETIVNSAYDKSNLRKLLFSRPMDINHVSLEELILLPGIGEITACKIIQFRQDIGFFLSVDELDNIVGPLNPKLLGALYPYLTVE